MKTFKNIFALLVLSIALYPCDADATLDEVEQAEQTEIIADTGNQGNEEDVREDED